MDPVTSSKVFNNPNIMDLILSNLNGGIMNHLNIRLISKLFDSSCIENIKKSHTTIKIEYIGDDHRSYMPNFEQIGMIPPDGYFDPKIFINYHQYAAEKLNSYLKFLELKKVPVKKIILKDLWKVKGRYYMHLYINRFRRNATYTEINSVTGIESVSCRQCKECQSLATICRKEYEMSRTRLCSNLQEKIHFDTLILGDRFLNSLHTKNISLNALNLKIEKRLGENISCDTLVLKVDEYNIKAADGSRLVHLPVPRKILERVCEKFTAKRFVLKLHLSELSDAFGPLWSRGLFSSFCFNDEFSSIEKTPHKIRMDHVELDLSDSLFCAEGITGSDIEWESYQNIIAIIRRLVAVNHISINFSHWSHRACQPIDTVIDNIIKTVTKDDPKDLTVDIRYFAQDVNSDKISLPDFPKFKLSKVRGDTECYKQSLKDDNRFEKQKWIGKRIKIENSQTKCEINLEIFQLEK